MRIGKIVQEQVGQVRKIVEQASGFNANKAKGHIIGRLFKSAVTSVPFYTSQREDRAGRLSFTIYDDFLYWSLLF